jgi:hypothetical protein
VEDAKNDIFPTHQYVNLPLHTKYMVEGELLPHDDMCPLEDICFKELHELAKTTSPATCMWEMNIALQHLQIQ